MSFADAIRTCLTKYVTFDGRARRSEFWYFYLFALLADVVATILGSAIKFSLLDTLVSLALLLPVLAAGARRLHDTGRSTAWLLLILTLIGIIPLIVFWAGDTTRTGDAYGPSPKPAAYPAG